MGEKGNLKLLRVCNVFCRKNTSPLVALLLENSALPAPPTCCHRTVIKPSTKSCLDLGRLCRINSKVGVHIHLSLRVGRAAVICHLKGCNSGAWGDEEKRVGLQIPGLDAGGQS